MEIAINTTQKPPFKLLEVCNLAVEVCQGKTHISQLQNKFNELVSNHTYVTLKYIAWYGQIVIYIDYSFQGSFEMWEFVSHEWHDTQRVLNPNLEVKQLSK